ncbi:hypothetical protein BH10ACT9_BH10ACT9_60730 [soil metagenome]
MTTDSLSTSLLQAAAFGDAADRWPLPSASTPSELWLRAVAAGGQGRYASAHSDLAVLRRQALPGSSMASLAHSTTGSLWRQLGWHRRARGWDGTALRLAVDDEARADALVGLAADALGIGRYAASRALLTRARHLHGPGRHPVRLAWVSAELAMATGAGDDAVRYAREAVELASAEGMSVRHRVKSDVVSAAALCVAGRLEESRAVADGVLAATRQWGLVPLEWAVASLLAGIGSAAHTGADVEAIRDHAADLVRHRGGVFAG